MTNEQYHNKGNICEVCASKINTSMGDSKRQEMSAINQAIKEMRQEMDYLGSKLNEEVTEGEREIIVEMMEQKFMRIKKLEKLLC